MFGNKTSLNVPFALVPNFQWNESDLFTDIFNGNPRPTWSDALLDFCSLLSDYKSLAPQYVHHIRTNIKQ